MANLLLLVAAYLLGAIPFSYLVGRHVRGVDIRHHGSGNLGATNVGRLLGVKYGLLVFALDAAKGFLPVYLFPRWGDPAWGLDFLRILFAGAAVVGHIFPVYMGFRGGKGAAAGLGSCLAMVPKATLVALVVFLVAVGITRFVSLGSILGSLTLPFAYLATEWERALGDGSPILCGTVMLAALVVYRHRSNIVRLVHGKEDRIRLGRGPAP